METPPNKAVKTFGWMVGIGFVLGTFFKFEGYPGGNALVLMGGFAFAVFYLPLWYASQRKASSNKWLVTWQFVTLLLTALTHIFKTMHWPGAGLLYYAFFIYVFVVVIPVAFYQLYKTGARSLSGFNTVLILMIMACLIFSSIGLANHRGNRIASEFFKNISQVHNASVTLEARNKHLLSSAVKVRDTSVAFSLQKMKRLRVLSDSVKAYIQTLRNHLVSVAESVSEPEAGLFDLQKMKNVSNLTVVTDELCGYGYDPKPGRYSGLELKQTLIRYKNELLMMCDSSEKDWMQNSIGINTGPGPDEDGNIRDWVFATFEGVPVSSALLTFEQLQHDVLSAESLVQDQLLRSLNPGVTTAIGNETSALGIKLENERKQKEIEQLEYQQKQNRSLLVAKDEEVDAHQTASLWFILGLVASGVMIFYIIRSNIIRKELNLELNAQKQLIEDKNREITDSIHYAKRIQQAILPADGTIEKALPDSFVLYKPKDVVSGDFYAFFETADCILLAAADCTGHGVPGAFMSMIGKEQLSHIIIEKGVTQPAEILNQLHRGIQKALNQNKGAADETRDGMDIAICKIEPGKGKLEYAGANRSLWLMRRDGHSEIKANKQPIGGLETEYRTEFTNHEIEFEKGDCIYMFSDGYADQFGGEKGKKYMLKNFQKLIESISNLPMPQQKEKINESYLAWKGNHEQVDDVLVIGVRL